VRLLLEQENIMTIAKKQTEAELLKKKPNYCSIRFDYGKTYILPYNEGIKILEAFQYAEYLNTEEYNNHTISGLPKDVSPEFTAISQQVYLDLKLSALLKVNVTTE